MSSSAAKQVAPEKIHTVNGTRIAVFQTFFSEKTRHRLSPNCIPIYVPQNDRFLENSIILELVKGGSHQCADFVGLFSWRFFEKIPISFSEIIQRMSADRFQAAVYSFFGAIPKAAIWRYAESKHPGILAAAKYLLSRMGIEPDLEQLEAPVIYQNHFLCRPGVLNAYCESMLGPAIRLMRDSGDEELQALLCKDAGYYDYEKDTQDMGEIFGQRFPTLHPFICERLFSTWLAISNSDEPRHVWDGTFVDPRKAAWDQEARSAHSRPVTACNTDSKRMTTRSKTTITTSLIVTSYGQETWYTQMCLQRIAEWKQTHHELIVVVHDESALMRAFLELFKSMGVIDVLLFAEPGHGHVRGVNLGMRHARGEFLVNICIDVMVGPGVVDECIKRLQGNISLGAIGWHYEWAASYPGTYWIEDRLHFEVRPRSRDLACRDGDQLLETYVEAIRESPWFTGKVFGAIGYERLLCFNGSFYCIRRDLWEHIGGLDYSRFPHFFADDLLCYAVLDCGYSIGNINPLYGSCENPGFFRQMNELKWQGVHDRNRHRNELRWIPWFGAPSLTVSELVFIDVILGRLEIGAAIACVGDFEQASGFECIDPQHFNDEAQLLLSEQTFNLVVCGEVSRLDKVKKHLSENGVLLVLSNVDQHKGLQYHDRLGVYFRTPHRLAFDRPIDSESLD